ncbi:MAG: outer membrane protein [Beijerinckiaceae bacterium]
MKRIVATLLAGAAMIGAASAADLPSRKVAPVAFVPAFSWTGFYVGLQGGYQWGRTTGTLANAAGLLPDPAAYNPNGMMVGAHVGYNYQINQIVVGLEGDLEWSDLSGRGISVSLARYHTTNVDWQASIRARLGIAIDRALIYVTGGVAFADVNHTIGFTPAVLPYHSYGSMRTGWTAGAGLEYAFTNNWTGRVEYRYADYGKTSATSIANNSNDRSHLTTHAVRVGVSYKF